MATPTVTVTAGSTSVVGTGTAFLAQAGDLFILAGITAVIASSVPSQITLTQPWPGTSMAGRGDFAVALVGPYWSTSVTTNKRLNELLDKLDGGLPFKFDMAGTLAGRAAFNNQPIGFVYLAVEPAPFTLYVKLANTGSASDWSAGQPVQTTPAQTTAEAQTAAAQAQAAAGTATTQAGLATSAAATSSANANATGADRTAVQANRAATGADAAATAADRVAVRADRVLADAAVAATAADRAAVHTERLAVDASLTKVEGLKNDAQTAAGQAQASASAAAADRTQTGQDRSAVNTALSNATAIFGNFQQIQAAVTAATGARDTAVTARDLSLGYRDESRTFRDQAQAAAASAEAASGIPAFTTTDTGKVLAVKADASGLEWSDDVEALALAAL